MSQQRDSAYGTYSAYEAMGAFIRVKLSSTSNKVVAIAGANEVGIGITQAAAGANEQVTVKEWSAPGTFKVTLSGATARNALLYPTAAGKFDDAQAGASGDALGYGLETGSGTGAVIEMVPCVPSIEAGAAMVTPTQDTLTNSTGGTNSGTTILAATATQTQASITSALLGGTHGGTVALNKQRVVESSAGAAADAAGNLKKILLQMAAVKTDVASVVTNTNNNFSDVNGQLNKIKVDIAAIIAALKAAGLMKSA